MRRLAVLLLALLVASGLLVPAGAQAAAACPSAESGCPMMRGHAAPPPCHGTAVSAGDCCALAPEAVPVQGAGRELSPPVSSVHASPVAVVLPALEAAAPAAPILARSGAPPLYTLHSSLLN